VKLRTRAAYVVGASANRTCIARREIEKRSRLVFHLVGSALLMVGDTGFEPETLTLWRH
jgi:hypothetical protein